MKPEMTRTPDRSTINVALDKLFARGEFSPRAVAAPPRPVFTTRRRTAQTVRSTAPLVSTAPRA